MKRVRLCLISLKSVDVCYFIQLLPRYSLTAQLVKNAPRVRHAGLTDARELTVFVMKTTSSAKTICRV